MTGVQSPCANLSGHAAIGRAVKKGIRALSGKHSQLVASPKPYRCSVNLDAARRDAEPNAARWDYVLATAAHSTGMEVHPARASEIDVMINKRRWAAQLLGQSIPIKRWRWIVPHGSPIQLTPGSPQARRLAAGGIEFPARALRESN
jgi:hypothetical protein